mmetsp:Transcript_10017/g.37156  ORF Transcript_10017/g.37156 Transcript_10017/m.37156 type:complete len:329 (-) Transcript_10017:769-1755(-)
MRICSNCAKVFSLFGTTATSLVNKPRDAQVSSARNTPIPKPPARSSKSVTTQLAFLFSMSSARSIVVTGRSRVFITPFGTRPAVSLNFTTPFVARNENRPRSTENTAADPAAAAIRGSTPGPPPEMHKVTTGCVPTGGVAGLWCSESDPSRRYFFSSDSPNDSLCFSTPSSVFPVCLLATSLCFSNTIRFTPRAYTASRPVSSKPASAFLGAASSAKVLACANAPPRRLSKSNADGSTFFARAFGGNVGRHSFSSTSHSGPDMVWRHRANVASRSSALLASRNRDARSFRRPVSCAPKRDRASSDSHLAMANSSRTPSKVLVSMVESV